jgi:Ni,Fe-hydrogenase I small subunit
MEVDKTDRPTRPQVFDDSKVHSICSRNGTYDPYRNLSTGSATGREGHIYNEPGLGGRVL